jgi:Flp pilus assembly protein TadD
LQRAQKLAPWQPGPPFSLAELLLIEGRGEEAVAMLEATLEQHPEVSSGHGLIGRWRMRQGRFHAAADAFRAAVQADRWDWLSHNELGVALFQAGEHEEALCVLEKAAWIHPADAGIQQNLQRVRGAN